MTIRTIANSLFISFLLAAIAVATEYPLRQNVPVAELTRKTSLFNGKNLDNFHAVGKTPNTAKAFSVRDGKLVSHGKPYGTLRTNKAYKNYRLTFHYRFVKKAGNSGVMVHCDETKPLFTRGWPHCVEAQLQSGNAGDFWTLSDKTDILTPLDPKQRDPEKDRHFFNFTDDSEKPVGEWNAYTIECLADTIQIFVNDQPVNFAYQLGLTQGVIGFQAEGAEVEFKDIAIEPITELTKSSLTKRYAKIMAESSTEK